MVVGELTQERDVIVIGGGPGGYTAAIRLAQLGREVTLIEKNVVGGVCLNEGCIPSKVFSHISTKAQEVSQLSSFGIEVGEYKLQFEQLQVYKEKVVTQLRKGVEALCKANKIEVLQGSATFLDSERIGVENGHQFDIYKFNEVIIATGSRPDSFPGVEFDHTRIVHSRSLYELKEVPSHLVIYGNDYIALEAAFSFKALGSDVTILFDSNWNGFGFDSSIERELQRLMKKNKIKIVKCSRLVKAESNEEQVVVMIESDKGEVSIEASHLYVQSSYKANVEDLGVDRLKMVFNEDGSIAINERCQTSIPKIYAIGDVTGGEQLAVKAIKQGKTAAEVICGQSSEWVTPYIPKVVHSKPPIASVGLTEDEAKAAGYEVRTGQFNLAGNGYAGILNQREGFAKIVSDHKTERILGVHLMGAGAIELISTAISSLEMVAREEDLKFPLYPHPSVNEGLLEAVEDLVNQAIHQAPSKKAVRVK